MSIRKVLIYDGRYLKAFLSKLFILGTGGSRTPPAGLGQTGLCPGPLWGPSPSLLSGGSPPGPQGPAARG